MRIFQAAIWGIVVAVVFSGRDLAQAWNIAGADILGRISELDKAWAGKAKETVMEDKMARSKQKTPPDWVSRDSGKIESGGKTYSFGVGVGSRLKNQMLLIIMSEQRAMGSIADSLGGKAVLEGSRALDWYADQADGSFYTLLCAESSKISSGGAPAGPKGVQAEAEADPGVRAEALKKAGVHFGFGDRVWKKGKPNWIKEKSRKVEVEGETYLLAVGVDESRNFMFRIKSAENKAKMKIAVLQTGLEEADISISNKDGIKVNGKQVALIRPLVMDSFDDKSGQAYYVLMSAEAP